MTNIIGWEETLTEKGAKVMGWWKINNGEDIIGDRPVDAITIKLTEIATKQVERGKTKPRLSQLTSSIETVIRDHEAEYLQLDSEEGLIGKISLKNYIGQTPNEEERKPNSEIIDEIRAMLNQIVQLYEENINRKPKMTEILACITFVLSSEPEKYLRDADNLADYQALNFQDIIQ